MNTQFWQAASSLGMGTFIAALFYGVVKHFGGGIKTSPLTQKATFIISVLILLIFGGISVMAVAMHGAGSARREEPLPPAADPAPKPVVPVSESESVLPKPVLPKPVPMPLHKITAKINVTQVNDCVEFKLESDKTGEQSSSRLTTTGTFTRTWDMEGTGQDIWFWWDTLDGEAYITISAGDTVLFEGSCSHHGKGEVNVKSTSAAPKIYVTGGSPHLQEDGKITHIKF